MQTQDGLKWTLAVVLAACLLNATSAGAAGATLSLVQNGKAVYTVVVPDGKDSVAMSAATMLANTVEKASGTKLAIVRETETPAGPKVFIGKTRAAEKAGLNVAAMKGIACLLKVVDGNLFLAGNDRGGFIKGRDYNFIPASKKAVHIFLRDYAGVRWLWPNSLGLGTEIPKQATLSFPADLNRSWTPAFDWVAAFSPDEGFEFNCSYIFNKCLEDPNCEWQAELDGFYRAAFGKAYVPMKEMFDALYQRLELMATSDPFGPSRWTPIVPGYTLPTMPLCSESRYTYYYPPHLIKYMAARFARAKELEPAGAVRAQIDLVERNFLYCQDIANVYHLYRAYQVSPSWESFAPLAAALKQRDVRVREFIAHDKSRYDGFPPMFHDLSRAITDGRGGSARMLGGPFKWNLDEIVQKKVLPDTGHRVPPFSSD